MRNAIPTDTIENTWRLRNAWAATARVGKKAQSRARGWGLVLGVVGAVLGAIAGQGVAPQFASTVALAAAVAVALAAYFGRELVTEEREERWVRARSLAEALERECWKCVLGVRPYDTEEAGRRLAERAAWLTGNTGLDRVAVESVGVEDVPTATTIDGYKDERVAVEMRWYEDRAARYRVELGRLRTLSFVAGGVAVMLGVVGIRFAGALGYVPAATTIAAALAAWMQASRMGATATVYQETASQLRLRLAVWTDGNRGRAELAEDVRRGQEGELVEACENIMAGESGAWRAEWLTKEEVRSSLP